MKIRYKNMADVEALKDEYIDHMMSPRNYGKINDYSSLGIGNNPNNNEFVETYLKVSDDDLIEDIKFQAIGCMSTVVTGSIFTDMIKGESIDEANSVMIDFIKGLENAPPETKACGEMIAKSFEASVINLQNRRAGKDEKTYTLQISSDCVVENE
jgi:nitrogen fixation NifU-like protein